MPGFLFFGPKMRYTLLITASVNNISAHRRALIFADTLLHAKHTIHTIFFYGESAGIGLSTRDLKNISTGSNTDWSTISLKGKTQLIICVASALSQGVHDGTAESKSSMPVRNIAPEFKIGGLGSLVEAITKSDRVLCFGG